MSNLMIQERDDGEKVVLRYRRTQRYVHFVLATSFTMLLLTGLILLWEPLGFLAAGSISRWIHRIGAIGFLAVPIMYLVLDRRGARELVYESFKYDKDDWAWAKNVYRYFMGHAREMPPQGRLNAGQKLHHGAVILVSALTAVTGIMLWFFVGSLSAAGLAWTVVLHDAAMLILTLLLIGHLYFTYVYKALSGMTTGWIEEVDARIEHPKWVEELEEEDAKALAQDSLDAEPGTEE